MVNLPANIKTQLIVGMEIHVELATRTKMFTRVPNVAHPAYTNASPNTLLDPVVIGMPGVLPVLNEQAVLMAIKVGLALNCEIARFTKWDRKSYYYPDLPKNYQISQYDLPLCGPGELRIPESDAPDAPMKTIRILRAHLEEDAGKLMHEAPGGRHIDHSIVDLNRAGTPLLEIVTEPDFRTPEQAVLFARTLRDICRHLEVSQGIMQKGHIRFEPNINVMIEKDGQTYRTPIVEIKNLNSFRALHGAISYEYQRQIDDWLTTGQVMGARAKSTRGWDDVKMMTTLQRHKEDADEYRYFPDPDLVPLHFTDAQIEQWRQELPPLPQQRREHYRQELGLAAGQIDSLLADPGTTALFEQILKTDCDPKRAATVLLNYGAKCANAANQAIGDLRITAQQVHDIVSLTEQDKISSSAAARLFELCCDHPETEAATLAQQHQLLQVSDTGALEAMIRDVLENPKNAGAIADIQAGKDKAIGSLIGQIMKQSKGQANPKRVTQLIKEQLQS